MNKPKICECLFCGGSNRFFQDSIGVYLRGVIIRRPWPAWVCSVCWADTRRDKRDLLMGRAG